MSESGSEEREGGREERERGREECWHCRWCREFSNQDFEPFAWKTLGYTNLLLVCLCTNRAMSKFSVNKKLDEGLALVQARVASLAVTKKPDQEDEVEVDVSEDPSKDGTRRIDVCLCCCHCFSHPPSTTCIDCILLSALTRLCPQTMITFRHSPPWSLSS